MKRAFTLGSGETRRVVVIEVEGTRMSVAQKKPDGTTQRSEKILTSDAEARVACERMVRELTGRGFVEREVASSKGSAPSARPARRTAAPKLDDDGPDPYRLEEAEPAEAAAPLLPRLSPAPGAAAEEAPKKKKTGAKKKKKKGKKAGNEDGLDRRVLAAVGAVGAVVVLFLGYVAYDVFLKPATIVGVWAGSMIDFEIGQPMVHSEYRLVLDSQKRASLTLQDKFTSVGTYTVKGDRLQLALKDVDDDEKPGPQAKEEGDDEEGGAGHAGAESFSRREYRIKLGRATLDLYDPSSGKQLVQLIRFREEPVIGGGPKPPAAPSDVAAEAVGEGNKDADARLVSVEFSPKDNAFKLRHPPGWQSDTGSRPDNTYSWGTFTKGSATVKVFADIQGSLMSGAAAPGQHEEGSELAPVHAAHELYKKTAAEEFSDYNESKPALFKGSTLGEGRIANFTASGGGLFGGKIKGYRVTLLTNDRRISIFCSCPESEFNTLKPTFLALCRSVSR